MTVQPTRDQRAMWRQIATDAGDDPLVNTLHPDEVLALLDQLDQAEARIEAWEKQYAHDLAQADLIADQAEARIKAVLTVVQEWESANVRHEAAPIVRAASTRIRRALDG